MENLLQGVGLFLCVGAVLLAAVVFFAFRALTRGARGVNQDMNRDVDREPTVFNSPGTERPRYDTREVDSRGGFGGVPQTGSSAQVFDRDDDRNIDRDFNTPTTRSGGLPPLDNDFDQDRDRTTRRRRDDDDDDVRSRGGFGS